ncbi:MAG: DUF3592 domain-containing protein [Gammaproteobacteria bacterium]|nr:DUF3592 domain-containing protein [Gammaproteobacteria bacterium]
MNDRKTFWGLTACFLLAVTFLAAGVYEIGFLMPLLNDGKRADATVVEIKIGVKGGKRALLQFVTEAGKTEVADDHFEMLFFRFEKGARVTVLYDPKNPQIATIDLGLWVWQLPMFFFSGFLILSILGIVLFRHKPRKTE